MLAFFLLLQACSGIWSPRGQPPAAISTEVTPPVPTISLKSILPVKAPTVVKRATPKIPMLLAVDEAPMFDPALAARSRKALTADAQTQSRPATALTGAAKSPPVGYFIPSDVFGKVAIPAPTTAATASIAPSTAVTKPPISPAVTLAVARVPPILLYASPATRDYYAAGGIDASTHTRAWEDLLRKKEISYELLTSIDQLEAVRAPTALIVASSIALSDREKQAIIDFQGRGGGVLSSWLSGVRDERGTWRGFKFMESALGVKILGTTATDEDDTFLILHGDSPVSHHAPAGIRMWMERINEWYPLRLAGRNVAANMMDWSRAVSAEKQSAAIVFDEREQPSGKKSRTVVLGFPERLWLSADAQILEPQVLDALMWVLRQPSAYLSSWPAPYTSALVVAVDVADTMSDTDDRFAQLVAELGGHATYFVLTEHAKQAADLLKKIKAAGHEVAYLGDHFEEFKNQSTNTQAKRIDAMLHEMKESGVDTGPEAGFHPPSGASDETTEKLLGAKGFGYLLAGLEASEARLPTKSTKPSGTNLVVVPNTQSDLEDLISEGDAAGGLKLFLVDLDLTEKMAGVSIIRISNRSAVTDAQFAEISNYLKSKQQRTWLSPAGKIAQWWREREKVKSKIDTTTQPARLTVTIEGDQPLRHAASVWVNLPYADSTLRLVPQDNYPKPPKVTQVDTWRSAVLLGGMSPGEYIWYLYFDRPATAGVK